jgi:hypothetical protein
MHLVRSAALKLMTSIDKDYYYYDDNADCKETLAVCLIADTYVYSIYRYGMRTITVSL